VDGNGSGLCPVAGFCVSSVEHLDSATSLLWYSFVGNCSKFVIT
jgi:hypothetical protein